MNVKISIIVPVYNVEKYLEECITSLLRQTFTSFEVILVDDGSRDGSGRLCDRYAGMDSRITVIHKTNGGLSSARNAGLDVARGEYVGFVDSDDWIDPDMYQVLFGLAKTHGVDITACNITRVDSDHTHRDFCPDTSEILFDRNSAMKELYRNERISFSAANKLYKRDLFDDLRFREGIVYEDVEFSYKMLYKVDKIYYTGRALYYYRFNDTSITVKQFSLKRLDQFEVKKGMYEFYKEHFPDYSDDVYGELFLDGLILFTNVLKYHRTEAKRYRYLIHADREILKRLMTKAGYSRKNKVIFGMALYAPLVLRKSYYYYHEKIKKTL